MPESRSNFVRTTKEGMFGAELLAGGVQKVHEAKIGLEIVVPRLGEILLKHFYDCRNQGKEHGVEEYGRIACHGRFVSYRSKFEEYQEHCFQFDLTFAEMSSEDATSGGQQFFRAWCKQGDEGLKCMPVNGTDESSVLAWRSLIELVVGQLSDQVPAVKQLADSLVAIGVNL